MQPNRFKYIQEDWRHTHYIISVSGSLCDFSTGKQISSFVHESPFPKLQIAAVKIAFIHVFSSHGDVMYFHRPKQHTKS